MCMLACVCVRSAPVPFGYDGERVIDDFVLLTVLCGNDFVPHLPSLDIGEGAMDALLKYYRYPMNQMVLPKTDTLHMSASMRVRW